MPYLDNPADSCAPRQFTPSRYLSNGSCDDVTPILVGHTEGRDQDVVRGPTRW